MKFGSTDRDFAKAGDDTMVIWPSVAAVAFPVMLVLVWSGPFGATFFGAPAVLLAWASMALIAMSMAGLSLLRRARRRALTLLVLPALTLIAALNAGAFWTFAMQTGEHLHFRMMRDAYAARVSKMSHDNGPRLAIFDWGGFVISHAVVFDESDEIMLPAAKQSAAWKQRIAGTELECGAWGSPLGGHYYIARIGC